MADRLISADALKAALQGLYQVAGWEKRDIHFSLSDMECNIDYMPTIEAVPLEDYRSMEQTVHKLTQAISEAEPIKQTIEKFRDYQIEWLTAHNDIEFCEEEENLIIRFLKDTAECAIKLGIDEVENG